MLLTEGALSDAHTSNSQKPLPCYASFKTHLIKRGFTVFPFEFECTGSDHPFVDLAARMGCMYWAFEYKSRSDSISRGVDQLRCYAEWFDYVVLVSEKTLDHRRSENYWELKSMGAGMWNYDPDLARCCESRDPVIQKPDRRNHRFVSRRFGAFERAETAVEVLGNQTRMPDYF